MDFNDFCIDDLAQITCLVGANNSGKSRLLADLHNRHKDSSILYKASYGEGSSQVDLAFKTTNSILRENNKDFKANEINSIFNEFGLEYSLSTGDTGEVFKNIKGIQQPISHGIEELGSGLKSLIYTIISIENLISENKTILLDEPETFLHPQWQKSFLRYLAKSLTGSSKIIIATHSPYIIDLQSIFNGTMRCHRVFQVGENIKVSKEITESTLKQLSINLSDRNQSYRYGTQAKEFLFSDKLLIVEGQDDYFFFKRAFEEKNIDIEIFNFGSGGINNIKPIIETLLDLDYKQIFCVTDGTNSKDKDIQSIKKLEKAHPERLQVQQLPLADIRDKSTNHIEGIFNTKGELKPEHKKYWTELVEKIIHFLNYN